MATLKPTTPLRPLLQTNVKPPSPMLTPEQRALKPTTPLRPLLQTNVKPPSPMLAPEQRALKPTTPLQPKNARKTPISLPQRRWRFQLGLGRREQRRWRFQPHAQTSEQRRQGFHARDFQCPRAIAGPGRTTSRRAEPHISDQAPPVWRAPEGPEGARGPGCGARGRWRGLAGLRGDAPSEARSADGSRAGRRPPAHTAAGPSGARNTSGTTSTVQKVRTPRSTPGSGRPGGHRGGQAH